MKIFLAKNEKCDRLKVERKKKKMKTKTKIKFDLNETIRRLNEISKGFEASANRIQVIVEDAEKKKQEAHEKFMKG